MTSHEEGLRGYEEVTFAVDMLWFFRYPLFAPRYLSTFTSFLAFPTPTAQHREGPGCGLLSPLLYSPRAPSASFSHNSSFRLYHGAVSIWRCTRGSKQSNKHKMITYSSRLAMPTAKHSVRGATSTLQASFCSTPSKHTVSISIHRLQRAKHKDPLIAISGLDCPTMNFKPKQRNSLNVITG